LPSGPLVDPGVGYDILSGDTLADALGDQRHEDCCETIYPDPGGSAFVLPWAARSNSYSTRPEDRQYGRWEKGDDGLVELAAQYIALVKAGAIGEQPSYAEVISASVRVLGVAVGLDGEPLPSDDALTLAAALAPLPQAIVPVGANLPVRPFHKVDVSFGHSVALQGLNFIYAPPGVLGRDGYLFPQVSGSPNPDRPISPDDRPTTALAYRTSSTIDAVLARHGAAMSHAAAAVQPTPAARPDGAPWWPTAAVGAGAVAIAALIAVWLRHRRGAHTVAAAR